MTDSEPPRSADSPPSSGNWLRRGHRFLRRSLARSIWIFVATGLLLRLTIQDRFHPWALIYYLTPIPALPIWLLMAGILWGRTLSPAAFRPRFSIRRLNQIAVVLSALWAFHSEYMDRAEPTSPRDLSVAFWNTARVPFGIDPVARQLREGNPTLIGLVEANAFQPDLVAEWQSELPGYKVLGTHFGGLIAVKGTVRSQTSYDLLPKSSCEQFDLTIEEQNFTVLLVDIAAQLNLSRRQPLQELADLIERLSDRPLIIMGDFNTPDDSVLFNPLRKHCRIAIRERGTGYAATWPMPLPVLTLDQIWVNEFVNVSSCQYRWSVYSDHRRAFSRVSFHAR